MSIPNQDEPWGAALGEGLAGADINLVFDQEPDSAFWMNAEPVDQPTGARSIEADFPRPPTS